MESFTDVLKEARKKKIMPGVFFSILHCKYYTEIEGEARTEERNTRIWNCLAAEEMYPQYTIYIPLVVNWLRYASN